MNKMNRTAFWDKQAFLTANRWFMGWTQLFKPMVLYSGNNRFNTFVLIKFYFFTQALF
jgi:hypothetical protein